MDHQDAKPLPLPKRPRVTASWFSGLGDEDHRLVEVPEVVEIPLAHAIGGISVSPSPSFATLDISSDQALEGAETTESQMRS
jgi:hypothetical protein